MQDGRDETEGRVSGDYAMNQISGLFSSHLLHEPKQSLSECAACPFINVNMSPMSRVKGTNYKESHSCINLMPLQWLCQPSAHCGCDIIYSHVWKYDCKWINISICVRDCTFFCPSVLQVVKCHRSGLNVATSLTKPTRCNCCSHPQTTNILITIALCSFWQRKRAQQPFFKSSR